MSEREDIVLTDQVRVAQFTLSAGERLPWHYHTRVHESVFCLSGRIHVLGERQRQVIHTGERIQFGAGQAHALHNNTDQPASYLLIQHGEYDFIECAAPASDC